MSSPRRSSLALTLVGAALLFGAAPAAAASGSGGSVSIDDGAVVWTGADGGQTLSYAFSDDARTGDPIVVFQGGPSLDLAITDEARREYGCAPQGGLAFLVSCFLHSAGTRIVGGSGPDTLTPMARSAPNFPVVLDGGAGRDRIDGTDSADRIDARDGDVDRVDCGGGQDAVFADSSDVIAESCEDTHRVTGPPATSPAPTSPLALVPPPIATTPPVIESRPSTPMPGTPPPTTTAPPAPAPQPTSPFSTKAPARCVVPRLTGLTLAAAKRRLRAAGCAVGRTRPRHPGKRWIVKTQRAQPGKALASRAKVSLALHPRPASRRAPAR